MTLQCFSLTAFSLEHTKKASYKESRSNEIHFRTISSEDFPVDKYQYSACVWKISSQGSRKSWKLTADKATDKYTEKKNNAPKYMMLEITGFESIVPTCSHITTNFTVFHEFFKPTHTPLCPIYKCPG